MPTTKGAKALRINQSQLLPCLSGCFEAGKFFFLFFSFSLTLDTGGKTEIAGFYLCIIISTLVCTAALLGNREGSWDETKFTLRILSSMSCQLEVRERGPFSATRVVESHCAIQETPEPHCTMSARRPT